MFYKIPLDADLTNTSYRCRKDIEDAIYIEYNEGYIGEDWEEVDETTMEEISSEWFSEPKEVTSEPTQLDRIESTLAILTADTVTAESIDTAISEGVNEV